MLQSKRWPEAEPREIERGLDGTSMKAGTAGPADKYSTVTLVRPLLVDEALGPWPRYALAFALMGGLPRSSRYSTAPWVHYIAYSFCWVWTWSD